LIDPATKPSETEDAESSGRRRTSSSSSDLDHFRNGKSAARRTGQSYVRARSLEVTALGHAHYAIGNCVGFAFKRIIDRADLKFGLGGANMKALQKRV